MRLLIRVLLLLLGVAMAPSLAKNPADSILSAVVKVEQSDVVFYASSTAKEKWGASLEAQKLNEGERHAYYPLVYNATGLGDGYGCTSKDTLLTHSSNTSSFNLSNSDSAVLLGLPSEPFVLLVDRGGCTFAEKAFYAQELGAAVLIVTDTREELYSRSSIADATVEEKRLEYSCSRGSGHMISNADINDLFSTSWSMDPGVRSCASSSKCSSHMCTPSGGANNQVCCIWDIPDIMGFSASEVVIGTSNVSNIVVVRISIADGNSLKEMLVSASKDGTSRMLISVYERDPPLVDPAQIILWIVACMTVLIGAYKGAAYERTKAQLEAALIGADATSSDAITQARVAYEEHNEQVPDHDLFNLSSWHALIFVVLGSVFLGLLFFVNMVILVEVLFGIGAMFTTFQVIWDPLTQRVPIEVLHWLPWRDVLWQWKHILVPAAWSIGNLIALALSCGIVLFWFFARFHSYAWILHDIFGVCFCLVCLRFVRLPNLKAALVLLVLFFLYDVCMVCILPYIINEEVMTKVATGGAQSIVTGDISSGYCLRYPTDTQHDCRVEAIPILLQVRKMLDWRAGYSTMSLGDIVLPGLLLVFCARYDYATRGQLFGRLLLSHCKCFDQQLSSTVLNGSSALTSGAHSGLDMIGAELGGNGPSSCRRGLFCLLIWGYTIGLLLANIGVVATGSGHPALMYLVPCTLGVLVLVGWRRGILSKLWVGPPELICGYAQRESMTCGAGLDIYDVTRLRGLSFEPRKAAPDDLDFLPQYEVSTDTPVSGGLYKVSEDTRVCRDSQS